MKVKTQKKWTLVAIFGMAYWFFGNLYEAIVISPNWVINSELQMDRLHQFFISTSPTHYFVPLTQFSSILIWILFFTNKKIELRKDLGKASLFGVLSTIVNIYIVSTVVSKLFAIEYSQYGEFLNTLCWRWNFLNIVRMTLVFITLYYLINTFRKQDKMSADMLVQ